MKQVDWYRKDCSVSGTVANDWAEVGLRIEAGDAVVWSGLAT